MLKITNVDGAVALVARKGNDPEALRALGYKVEELDRDDRTHSLRGFMPEIAGPNARQEWARALDEFHNPALRALDFGDNPVLARKFRELLG